MQVREAVRKASQYLPDVLEGARDKELQLEGVEKTDDGRNWKVTFSYSSGMRLPGSITRSGKDEWDRDYWTVKVRDSDGEFIGAQNGVLLGEF
jgi:hypothetical protein